MSSEGTEGASPQCGQNPAFGRRDSGYFYEKAGLCQVQLVKSDKSSQLRASLPTNGRRKGGQTGSGNSKSSHSPFPSKVFLGAGGLCQGRARFWRAEGQP